jgi:hypothetical protein
LVDAAFPVNEGGVDVEAEELVFREVKCHFEKGELTLIGAISSAM